MRIILFSFILFLCLGIVSASENITDNDNIEDLIDNCEDQGIVKLDERTYELNPESETHLYLNKSISIEGTHEKTIIDGKNSTLFLDVVKEPEPDYNGTIIIAKDIYDIKNTGKNIIFKNITFKDLNLISRHKMDFLDCNFIKTNFTSKELNNTFENCIFDESKIELHLYDGYIHNYYSKITNCTLHNSRITSKVNIFICIVGSSMVFIKNGLDLKNSNLINSDISLSHYKINISNSKFSNSKLTGQSDSFSIVNTSSNNQKIYLDYSDINFEQSNFNNSEFKFTGGYYAKGCNVVLKNNNIYNSNFKFSSDIFSHPSSLTIQNSSVENCEIKTTETDIKINNSTFNESWLELSFSNLDMANSLFYSNGSVCEVIKTKTESDPFTVRDNNGTETQVCIPYQVKTNYTSENSYLINGSGKHKISSEDINVDTVYQISYNRNINYYTNDIITFNVRTPDGNPVANLRLLIENPNKSFTTIIITDENGNAHYTLDDIGKVTLKIFYENIRPDFWQQRRTYLEVNLIVKPKVIDLKLTKNFKFNKYSKVSGFLKAKIISYNNLGDLSGMHVIFKLFYTNKYNIYHRTTDSNGVAYLKIPDRINAGIHKIQIIASEVQKTTFIKIDKARTIVKAPKIISKFKKSKYFTVIIKNKETKKLLSNVKVKIKVFSGKKFKTYTVKTNKNGIAKLNIKTLKIGIHKVIISSGNKNYYISAKSQITIKK
ncbi:carboxypeptidase-like regulatory domain-containing protein [uncultured Methanobrevibacter sp.]|uniref:carboxypeptidase-like regulatory domain-containing protein n=1 Tax=uncultured Methanobrevibacter sp. TaxID=253161 RepID=UPI0025FD415B|nr:carboxypeptidase-like regulatory domain-containing protein [uncultured Methanobrevibacter sp.]